MNYKDLVHPQTFIGKYMKFMYALESPYAYDFWCACSLISVAVGRHVYVPRPRTPVYLNWYILLVAESGVTRKSTCVRIVTKIIRSLSTEKHPIELVETKSTPEAIEHMLHQMSREHDKASCAICIAELATFLGREKYNITMPALLTDLYDSPTMRSGTGTIKHGPTLIKNVYISFLSASTPSWLARAVNPDVVEGGFTSRCIFVVSERRKRYIAWPKDETEEDARADLVTHLTRIAVAAREGATLDIAPSALELFEEWYVERMEHRDAFRASFESREDSHVLRLAATLAISDGTWRIGVVHIQCAISLISQVKEHGAAIFAGSSGTNKTVLGVDKLRSVLIAGGLTGVKQHELKRQVREYLDSATADIALDIMQELKMVQKFEGVKVGSHRPATIYRGTHLVSNQGALELILQELEPTA